MKSIPFSLYALCMLLGAGVIMQPTYADEEAETTAETASADAAQNEDDGEDSAAPDEDSKEAKRAKLIACQKQVADEFKDIRQLANLLKKAKNGKDYAKVNKQASAIIKKYAPLYIENQPQKVNDVEITVEDLVPAHTKFASKRKNLYKDFIEFSENQRSKQQRSSWDNAPQDDDRSGKAKKKAKKKAKDKKDDVEIDFTLLDKVKQILRVNQEKFVDEIDAETEEENAKKSNYPY